MIDDSKAFDKVNYCKLFNELLKRERSPFLLKLLVYMYTSQTLRVKWEHAVSNYFPVRNGVKLGGVLSPLLFAIYTDSIDTIRRGRCRISVGCTFHWSTGIRGRYHIAISEYV